MRTSGEKHFESFFTRKGYTVEKKDKGNQTKNPDFQISKNGNLVAFCEVKDVGRLDISYFKDKTKPLPRDSQVIAQKIHHAYKQLHAANPNHVVPNIVAFYCDRLGTDAYDMHEAILGYVLFESGYKIYRKWVTVDNRIKDEKSEIDIYIFYDPPNSDFMNGSYAVIYITKRFSEAELKQFNFFNNEPMWDGSIGQ